MNQPSSHADSNPWYLVANVDQVPSPALLVYPDRAAENIRRMVRFAGGAERLRPHAKTHKMAEVARLQMAAGIHKFKCSTLAEAEMLAGVGAQDILLAFPQVGPNVDRFARLAVAFPTITWSTVADDLGLLHSLSRAFASAGVRLQVLLDIDNGMHRSGIEPGPAAVELYRQIAKLPGLEPGGLHVYDGHIRDLDLAVRAANIHRAFEPIDELRKQLTDQGCAVPRVVAGGSGSFPVHARRSDLECSPGTGVFWDLNYRSKFPESDFLYAALLLARVISKPGPNRLCVDLGYKAVSPDNPYPRVEFLNLSAASVLNHSEEHLALETDDADRFAVGDALYGVPYHVCPTVALYQEAVVVKDGVAGERWPIAARARRLTY
jgi:D-serine deaminase-like pyridoxal phosphate-dependent protein